MCFLVASSLYAPTVTQPWFYMLLLKRMQLYPTLTFLTLPYNERLTLLLPQCGLQSLLRIGYSLEPLQFLEPMTLSYHSPGVSLKAVDIGILTRTFNFIVNVWVGYMSTVSQDGAQITISSLQHPCVVPARIQAPHLPSLSNCFFFAFKI